MSNTQIFIFSFSEEGFESIVNLTEIDMANIQAKLAGKKEQQSAGTIMHLLKLRARFNAERKLEVWVLGADDGLTEYDLWDWANADPQGLADILRERGTAVYGAEYHRAEKKIT